MFFRSDIRENYRHPGRTVPDRVPYVTRNKKVAKDFRVDGGEIQKDLYGEGGNWWWPASKEMDPAILGLMPSMALSSEDM